jgi:septum formation protein
VLARALADLPPLVLASRSPQRRALLAQLGIPFTVREPAYDEVDPPDADAPALARAHAVGKARSVAGDLVLAVDTVVALDRRIYGKPADEAEARAHLTALAGRTHTVVSGLCLRAGGREHARVAQTDVRFWPLAAADVDWYVATGEWRGRAGAYAVQERGAALVREIRGDYTNVVGLLVEALAAAAGPVSSPRPTG